MSYSKTAKTGDAKYESKMCRQIKMVARLLNSAARAVERTVPAGLGTYQPQCWPHFCSLTQRAPSFIRGLDTFSPSNYEGTHPVASDPTTTCRQTRSLWITSLKHATSTGDILWKRMHEGVRRKVLGRVAVRGRQRTGHSRVACSLTSTL